MLPLNARALVTIAMTVALLAIGAPGWAQICATAPAPATPAAPMTPAAPATAITPAPAFNASGNTSLANGLVSYWKFDDASGTTVADAVSSSTGTWNGALGSQWTTGKVSGGGNFNGTDNSISSTVSLGLASGAPRTISIWAKPTVVQGSPPTWWYSTLFADSTLGTELGFQSNVNGDQRLYYAATTYFIATYHPDNAWHHFAYVYTGTTLTLYLDGINTETVSYTAPALAKFYIGNGTGSAQVSYRGIIDEVGIWNRALSASEVATLYNGGSGDPFGSVSCGFSY